MFNILVTGGAGFIGSHIVDDLINCGYNLTVIDNLSTGDTCNVNPKANFIKCDIRENSISSIFDQCNFDYVFHLAAQINLRDSIRDPVKDADINITGSLNLIENSRRCGVKKFIFASTGGAIYSEEGDMPFNEDSPVSPKSPYGMSKFSVENYLKLYKSLYGLDYVCLRFSNVFGPRQNSKGEAGVISIFMDNICKNKDLVIFGDGNQTRDFVYVKDVAEAALLSLREDVNGTFNVSTGVESSINDVSNILLKEAKSKVNIVKLDPIQGEMIKCYLDSSKIKKIGWKPKFSLKEGIVEIVKHSFLEK